MGEVDGSTLVARALKQQGAGAVFTVVGGPVIEAIGACGEAGVRPIGTRHEQAAAFAALAYGYVGNTTGVCLLASGPAVTNAVTGAHVAWDNCWPLVILGGSASQRTRGLMSFQEADSVAMMAPVTKWSVQIDSPARVPEMIAMGFRKARAGRPGPVYLDLPSDVLSGKVDEEQVRPASRVLELPPQQADARSIERAAELLLNAERPLLIVGKGVRWSEPVEELRRLVDDLHLPFIASPMGRGFIPDDHALNYSSARGASMRGADVVLVIGARLNWMFGMGRGFADDVKIIHVDIEPEEIGLQCDVEVGIVADAKQALVQLLAAIEGRTDDVAARAREGAWLKALDEARQANEAALAPLLASEETPLNHHRLMREIRDFIPRETIITVDGQISYTTARQVLPSYTPASRLNSGSNGCMGVAVPFAIGAALARPGTPVLSLNGDSAFGFNGLEVETALRYDLPIVFVVDNNDGIMGNVLERQMFPDGHDEPVATYGRSHRYDLIAEAFGGHAEHVERPEEIRPALERAFASGKAAVINVAVDPEAIWPLPRPGRSASSLMGY